MITIILASGPEHNLHEDDRIVITEESETAARIKKMDAGFPDVISVTTTGKHYTLFQSDNHVFTYRQVDGLFL